MSARARAVRLVGDLGGTHARFATLGPGGCLEQVEVLTCANYPRVEDAIADYLGRRKIGKVRWVCLAVAGPVDRDPVDLPNSRWQLSRHRVQEALDADPMVINDLTAQALCIDLLRPDDLVWLGAPRPRGEGIRGVVGPGTGLGVAVQMPGGDILPSEGGHVGFAPTNDHEMDLLRALQGRFRRVSVERLASGPGLENLYWANRRIRQPGPDAGARSPSACEIAEFARRGDGDALRSVEDLLDVLAGFAGDLALTAWTTAGIYLSGGVMRGLIGFLDTERFRSRFQDKGRFAWFCETVPLAWIRAEHPGLLGCAAALAAAVGAPVADA